MALREFIKPNLRLVLAIAIPVSWYLGMNTWMKTWMNTWMWKRFSGMHPCSRTTFACASTTGNDWQNNAGVVRVLDDPQFSDSLAA